MRKNTKKNKRIHAGLRLPRIKKQAFSSLELILVVALVAIIGLSSIPFLSRFFVQSATSDTYTRLLAEFRKAQTYAQMGKQDGPWGVYYGTVGGTKQVILYQGTSYATRINTAFDESYAVNPNVTITGLSDINFAQVSGTPSASTTITIRGTSNTTRTIQINAQGIVNYALAGPTYTPGPPTATPTPSTPTFTPTPTYTPPSGPPVLDAATANGPKGSNASSWSQTVANHPNRLVVVGIGATSVPSGITYAGSPLTLITSYCGGDCTSLWYIVNPAVGTNTVSVSGAIVVGGGSASFYNVNQQTPIGNYVTGTSTSSSVSVTVSGTNTNQFVFDNVWLLQTTTLTPGSGQTATWTTGTSFTNVDGSRKKASSGSTSMSWSGGSGNWYEAAAAIN